MDAPLMLSPAPAGRDQTDVRGQVDSLLDVYGLEYTPDGAFIRWSPRNKKHPRNWGMDRKVYDSCLIIFLDLFTYVLFDIDCARLLMRLRLQDCH